MSPPLQRTVSRAVTLEGTGVHSGEGASVTLCPAAPGAGIVFRRVDLDGAPEIPAHLDYVVDTELGTSLGRGEARLLTVEHVLAACVGSRIDNLTIDVDGPELPIRDGSFSDYLGALDDAGPLDQEEAADVVSLHAPVSVAGVSGQSYVATPAAGLRVSATIDFDHPCIGRQFGSFVIDEAGFRNEIASARTFGFAADAEAMRARGRALGASLDNTLVLDAERVLNESLRYDDEFLRHKTGDLVGDVALLGKRLEAHVVAERPSHAGNVRFVEAVRDQVRSSGKPVVDAAGIMDFLPHRYPMLLVDRVVEYREGERIVGIKNVTLNEPFFQGHFPGHPIMPGVLIVEAMAQCGGLLLMNQIEDRADKVVYFMTMDNVKFRHPVTPGDTLVFELELGQVRRRTFKFRGRTRVNGKVVAEADLMAAIMDR